MIRRGPDIPAIDALEADRRLREDVDRPILLDVREPDEFVAIRAPGATLFPTSTFMLRIAELPRDRPILVICRSGNRSASVTDYLLRSGWTDVVNISGGMIIWERAGLPVRRGPTTPGDEHLGD